MRWLIAFFLLWPLAALAQQTQEERDVGWIVGMIEDNLNSVSRTVLIDGFDGALSSRATVERISIADAEGVWFVATDLVLDWTRSELLTGEISVQELSAGQIELIRMPIPEEQALTTGDLPAPETTPFALPELPVSVQIDEAAIERIVIGEAVFGQEMILTMTSSVSLEGGEGQASLVAERIDEGPTGLFRIAGSFSNTSRILDLDLTLEEGPDGIAATLLALPGTPGVSLTAQGTGPITDYRADISLATAAAERLGGVVTFVIEPGIGRVLNLDLGGNIAAILAPAYRPFFGDEISLTARAVQSETGAVDLSELALSAEAIDLTGTARFAPDGWPELLDLSGTIAARDGGPVRLPLGAPTFTQQVALTLDFNAAEGERWTASFRIAGLDRPEFDVDFLTLSGGGTIARGEGMRPGRVTAAMDYGAEGITLPDAALQEAVGSDLTGSFLIISADGDSLWIERLSLAGAGIEAEISAQIAGLSSALETELTLTAEMADFSRLQRISGTGISGSGAINVEGTVVPLERGFDLAVDVTSGNLGLGIAEVDPMLRGDGRLTLTAARDETGITVDAFTLSTELLSGTGQMQVTSAASIATFDLALAEIAEIVPRLSGPATIKGLASLPEGAPATFAVDIVAPGGVDAQVSAELTPHDGGSDLRAFVDASLEEMGPYLALAGLQFEGAGSMDVELTLPAGGPLDVAGEITGPSGLAGQIELSAPIDGQIAPFTGAVDLQFADVGPYAALAGAPLDGPAQLMAVAQVPEDGDAMVLANISGPNGLSVVLTAQTPDPQSFRPFEGAAQISVDDIAPFAALAGIDFAGALNASASAEQGVTGPLALSLSGQGPGQSQIGFIGTLGTDDAALPAQGRVTLSAQSLAPFATLIGQEIGGAVSLEAEGTAQLAKGGASIAAQVQTTSLALGIPTIDRLLRGAGVVEARVLSTEDGILAIQGLDARFNSIRLTAEGEMAGGRFGTNFTARLRDIGLIVPELSGPVTAFGSVTQDPGGPLGFNIEASGAGGITATAAGSYGPGNTADLTAQGSGPLGLVNRFTSAARLEGLARFDLALRGAPTLGNLTGTISTNGARAAIPSVSRALENVALSARLSGGRAQIDSSAEISTGGRLEASGGLALSAPFAADLSLSGTGLVIEDPSLYATTADARLSLTGPLTGGARIAGEIALGQVDLQIPSASFGSLGSIPDITHVGDSAAVRETRLRAGVEDTSTARSASAGPIYGLDLSVTAPRRIFVRGRGLDAELGGTLRIGGTTANVIPDGRFSLIRGRLDLLGQRFTFTEGSATLIGGFIPLLRLVATTSRDDVDVRIIVDGPADAPEVRFESSPELPQDEVLSQLIFGRSITEISPLQAVQLASAVATLAGRGGGGLVNGLREGFGLDDLDLTTTEDGNAAVRAGAYLSENV